MSPGQNHCGLKLLHLPDSSHHWRLLLSTASCHELRRCGSSRCWRLAASSNHCTCNGDLRPCSAIEEIPGRSIPSPQTILLSSAGGLKEAHNGRRFEHIPDGQFHFKRPPVPRRPAAPATSVLPVRQSSARFIAVGLDLDLDRHRLCEQRTNGRHGLASTCVNSSLVHTPSPAAVVPLAAGGNLQAAFDHLRVAASTINLSPTGPGSRLKLGFTNPA